MCPFVISISLELMQVRCYSMCFASLCRWMKARDENKTITGWILWCRFVTKWYTTYQSHVHVYDMVYIYISRGSMVQVGLIWLSLKQAAHSQCMHGKSKGETRDPEALQLRPCESRNLVWSRARRRSFSALDGRPKRATIFGIASLLSIRSSLVCDGLFLIRVEDANSEYILSMSLFASGLIRPNFIRSSR